MPLLTWQLWWARAECVDYPARLSARAEALAVSSGFTLPRSRGKAFARVIDTIASSEPPN
jgi:hypothetical protein